MCPKSPFLSTVLSIEDHVSGPVKCDSENLNFHFILCFMRPTKMSQPRRAHNSIPKKIRVSTGTGIVLGLVDGKIDATPTTAYLMTYRKTKCSANCKFCPQARTSSGKAGMLSRVSWPAFPTKQVIDKLKEISDRNILRRVCIQALNYPEVFTHLQAIAKKVSETMSIPISVSCQPLNAADMKHLAEAGVDRIGIPLDAANSELFNKVKGKHAGGPYRWKRQFELLKKAVNIFGRGFVSTHLIVGLGETENEMVDVIQNCVDMGVLPGLFAFTPIRGTRMENESQPPMQKYRRIQAARHLILNGISRSEKMLFDDKGQLVDFGVEKGILTSIVQTGQPFLTSGCPDCNRPYYNEKPSGPIYNYPRKLREEEVSEIQYQLNLGRGSDL